MYHSHKDKLIPLTTSAQTPFSRYTALGEAEPDQVTERPLRLLFAIANPSDLPEGFAVIKVEEEVEMMPEALGDLRDIGQYQVAILPGRTGLPADQRARLERGVSCTGGGPRNRTVPQEAPRLGSRAQACVLSRAGGDPLAGVLPQCGGGVCAVS